MQSIVKKFSIRMFASLLLILFVTGCSEPAATPIDKRPPGNDLSPEARAAKRGDDALPGASAATPATGEQPAPSGK